MDADKSVQKAQAIAALVACGLSQEAAAIAWDKANKVDEMSAKAKERAVLVLQFQPEIEAGISTPFGTFKGRACTYLLETEKGSRTEEGFEYTVSLPDGKVHGPFYARGEFILNRTKALKLEHDRLFTGGRDSKTVARSQAGA